MSDERLQRILETFEDFAKRGDWQKRLVQIKTRELLDDQERQKYSARDY